MPQNFITVITSGTSLPFEKEERLQEAIHQNSCSVTAERYAEKRNALHRSSWEWIPGGKGCVCVHRLCLEHWRQWLLIAKWPMVLQAQDFHLHVQHVNGFPEGLQRNRITHGFFKLPKEISLIKAPDSYRGWKWHGSREECLHVLSHLTLTAQPPAWMLDLPAAQGKDFCCLKALWKHTGDAKLRSCVEPVASMAGTDTSQKTSFPSCRGRVMCHKKKYLNLFSSFFLTHQILEEEHHITLLRENEGHYSHYHYSAKLQQQYHLRLFILPWSHSGVVPITETCPARLVWPARHVLKEVLCRREIWSEWLRGRTPKEQSKSRMREQESLPSQGDSHSHRSLAGHVPSPSCMTKLSYSLQQITIPVIKITLFSLCQALI